jgi:hypothetical protein
VLATTPPRRNQHHRYIYPPTPLHLWVRLRPPAPRPLWSSVRLLSIPLNTRVTTLLTSCLVSSSMHILHPNSPELPGSLLSKQARAEVPTNTTDDVHHQQADMPDAILDDISHRRFNPLRSSWVLVSPHRTKRPWQGAQESAVKSELPDYDEAVRLSEQFGA